MTLGASAMAGGDCIDDADVSPPRRAAEIEVLPEELGQAKAQGEGGGKDQPGIGHQAVVVEGRRRFGCGRGGGVVAPIGCSFSGTGFLFQNHYPRCAGAPSCRFRTPTRRPPSVDSG